METNAPSKRVFQSVWFGQTLSLVGSGMTAFALGIYVFQLTGSVVQFGMVVLLSSIPKIILAPLAGVVVDRQRRKMVLLLSDTGTAVMVAILFLLLMFDSLSLWHIYALAAVSATFGLFHELAYSSSITLLVEKESRQKANGLVQLGAALAHIVVPLVAGVLIGLIGLQGIIVIDLVTFAVAMTILIVVKFPELDADAQVDTQRSGIAWSDVGFGWRRVRRDVALVTLLFFAALVSMAIGAINVLFTPMVLTFATPEKLGIALAVGGCGMLVGSVFIGAGGGPKKPTTALFGFLVLTGIGTCITGSGANLWFIGAGLFMFFFSVPAMTASAQTLWQNEIEPEMQGRVFAIRRMVATMAMATSYLVAPLVAEHYFEPALAPSGRWSESVGSILGTGEGRGIAFMFTLIGITMIITALAGLFNRTIRELDMETPTEADIAS